MDLERRVDDHEERLRKLEESDLKRQVQLVNIEKNLVEVKCLINENSKEQQKTINEFTNKVLDAFTSDKKHKSEEKFYNTKQFWAIIAALISAMVAFLVQK